MSVQNMEKGTKELSSRSQGSAGSLQRNTVNGQANVCPRRLNGKKQQEALTEIFILGEIRKLTAQEQSLWTDREEKAVLLKN